MGVDDGGGWGTRQRNTCDANSEVNNPILFGTPIRMSDYIISVPDSVNNENLLHRSSKPTPTTFNTASTRQGEHIVEHIDVEYLWGIFGCVGNT